MKKQEVLILERDGSGDILGKMPWMKKYRVTTLNIRDSEDIESYFNERGDYFGERGKDSPLYPMAVIVDGNYFQNFYQKIFSVEGESKCNLIIRDLSKMDPEDFIYIKRKLKEFEFRRKNSALLEKPVISFKY